MPKGVAELSRAFRSRILQAKDANRTRLECGYSAEHAVYVHENMEMVLRGQRRKSGIGVYWGTPGGNRGRSKFLEYPMKRLSKAGTLTRIIAAQLRAGATPSAALRAGGEKIMEESQPMVPVEYGDLKKSGFVKVRKK